LSIKVFGMPWILSEIKTTWMLYGNVTKHLGRFGKDGDDKSKLRILEG